MPEFLIRTIKFLKRFQLTKENWRLKLNPSLLINKSLIILELELILDYHTVNFHNILTNFSS